MYVFFIVIYQGNFMEDMESTLQTLQIKKKGSLVLPINYFQDKSKKYDELEYSREQEQCVNNFIMLEFQENFTLYNLLDVSPKATLNVITKKIRKIYHYLRPDKNKSLYATKACYLIGIAKKNYAMKN